MSVLYWKPIPLMFDGLVFGHGPALKNGRSPQSRSGQYFDIIVFCRPYRLESGFNGLAAPTLDVQ